MNMNVMCETEKLVLKQSYEYVVLYDVVNDQELFFHYFWGDPTCCIIDDDNKWAFVGGHHLILWKTDSNSIEIIDEESLRHIHSIRLKGDSEIEILTDPWSEDSAIWEYDLNQESLNRIRSFRDYLDSPYTDDVLW